MTPYVVDWSSNAIDLLADIWHQSLDRNAVNEASAAIDRELARDPLRHGTELSEGLYKIVVAPLAVYYEIDDSRNVVEVSGVSAV